MAAHQPRSTQLDPCPVDGNHKAEPGPVRHPPVQSTRCFIGRASTMGLTPPRSPGEAAPPVRRGATRTASDSAALGERPSVSWLVEACLARPMWVPNSRDPRSSPPAPSTATAKTSPVPFVTRQMASTWGLIGRASTMGLTPPRSPEEAAPRLVHWIAAGVDSRPRLGRGGNERHCERSELHPGGVGGWESAGGRW